MKILIAEDNAFYRRMLEATLAQWGYEVLAVDNGGKVNRHEVALGGQAVNANERAEALAQRGEARVDVLVAHFGRSHRDLQRVGGREGDLRAHFHRCRELEALVAALEAGDLHNLDLWLAVGADALLLHGLRVPAGKSVVDGVLNDRALANTLLEDLRRHLALAEAGNLHLRAHVLVGVLHHGRDVLFGEGDCQLDGCRVDLLKGAGHCYSCVWMDP